MGQTGTARLRVRLREDLTFFISASAEKLLGIPSSEGIGNALYLVIPDNATSGRELENQGSNLEKEGGRL